MNELEKYVQFLQDSGEIDIKGKVEKWKKDNNWGQEKPEVKESLLRGTVFEPIQTIEETKDKFNLGINQAQAEVDSLKKIDPVVETETSTGSTDTVSDSVDGSSDLASENEIEIDKDYYNRAVGIAPPNNFLIDEGQYYSEFSLSAPKTEISSGSQELKGSDQIINLKGPGDPLGLDEPKKQVPDTFFEDLTKEFEAEQKSGINTTESFIDGFILENDLDLEYENLYFNQKKSTKFVDNFYGGADALKKFGVNAVDFEGFLNRNGYADNHLNNLKEGEYEDTSIYGKDNKLAEERHLRKYLNLYISRQDYKINQLNKLEKIKKDPKFKTPLFGNARNNVLNAISKVEESNIYLTTINQQKQQDYLKSKFTLSTAKDKEYAKARIDYAKELDQRGDWYAAAANAGSFLAEGGDGFLTGMRDLVNFGLDITGFDLTVDKDRNYQAEEQLSKNSSYYTTITDAKTITKDGIEYAKDSKGNIYNVSAGYNVSGIITGLQLESLDKEIEKSGVKKTHNSLRGYLTIGGNVTGNVVSQVIGQKGFGTVTKAAKLKTLASVNGFKKVSDYKKMVNLANSIGGKAKSAIRIPVKKSTADAMLFQGSYGAATGYNNTLAQAKQAGFNDAEAEALAFDAAQYMAVWYAATGPISDRTTWLDNVGGRLGIKKIIANALTEAKKTGTKNFSQTLKNQLTNLSYKLKSKGYNFAKEGGKETLQEDFQQRGEFLWINPTLNTKAKTNFLQDTYSNDEAISTSVLSFTTGGLLSQMKVPSFKPNTNAQISNYTYVAKNADKAKIELDKLVDSGFATQAEADQLMENAKAILNQTPKMPKWLKGDYVLNVAKLMQQKQDIENQKKSTAKAFHGPLNDDIENLDLEIDAFVRQSADEKRTQLQKGVGVFVDAVAKASNNNVDMVNLDSTAEANAYRQEMQDKGNTVYQSDNYGDLVIDGKTGDITVIIDDQVNTEDNVTTTEVHEGGHLLISATVKKDPTAATKLGNSVLEELANNSNITIKNNKVAAKIANYVAKGVSTADIMEEILMFTSEALINGDIVFNETAKTKIGDVIRRTLQNVFGIKVKFKSGESVINFLRDYNKTIESGKASKGLVKTAVEGGEVTIKDSDIDAAKKLGRTEVVINEETGVAEDIEVTPKKPDSTSKASKRVYQEVEALKPNLLDPNKKKDATITAAYSLVDEAIRRMRNINLNEDVIDDIARTFALDEKRGLISLIDKWTPDRNDSVMGYLNAKSASGRSLFDARLQEFYEADPRYNEIIQSESQEGVSEKMQRQTAAEQDTEVVKKPVKRKIKPSSFISNDAVTQIKKQIQEKIKDIDPKNLTFKKLGDLAPEIIAKEIGIPVKKLTVPAANLSKADATAIQQFVNKNADKLLKILPEGAVVEAATDKLLGTSTGVPKGLLDAFYTKKTRLTKGAGLSPFVLNKGITKAKFLEAFGIVDGKKQEGFNARSSQAQALKGIANLYGRLVTNEIVRSDTDLSLEAKQDVAAGKSKSMASKRITTEAEMSPKLKKLFVEISQAKNINQALSTIGVDAVSINDSNRIEKQKSFQNAIEKFKLDLNTFLAGSFAASGAVRSRSSNGDVYYSLSNGERILGTRVIENGEQKVNKDGKKMFNQPTLDAISKKFGQDVTLVASRGRLYYGATDPAYIKAKLAAEKNTKDNKFKAAKIGLPPGIETKITKEFINKKAAQSKMNMNVLDSVVTQLSEAVANGMPIEVAATIITQGYQATSGLIKIAAPFKYASSNFFYALNGKKSDRTGKKYREEHNPPASVVGASIILAIKNNAAKPTMDALRENYYQTQLSKSDDTKIDQAKLASTTVDGQTIFNNPISRLAAAGIDLQTLINPLTGKTIAQESGFGIDPKVYNKYNANEKLQASSVQNEAILEGLKNPDLDVASKIKASLPLVPGKSMASKRDSDLIPDAIKYDRPIAVQTAINALEKTDKALGLARKLDQPVKKIRVFDFDDTLARSKSMVIVNMPDGSSRKINATQFAQQASDLESQGAEFDFTEFSKVVEGKKGPLFEVAQKIANARGTEDVFILTARPQNADGPIKAFMKANGIDIPLKNITGLGDGTAEAKAGWIMGKAAEGYNDFYFADDAIKNVKAVKDVLSQIDVKSEVQLAKASKRITFDTIVNDMIEDSAGIEAYKQYSAARAKTVGANKGKFNFFIPASAEDFTGLLYKMLGKGKRGDAQMAFLKTNLLDPYDRAESAVTQAKIAAANDFKALKQNLKTLPKSLSKPTGIAGFTFSQAARVSIWSKQGMNIPGLSKRDIKELNDFVNKNAELSVFTNELIKIQKGKPYPKPGDNWLGGNITSDIINDINKVNRAEYQQEWRENVDIIFSEDNMNKMEAAYGTRWREAMEDSLRRMKSGSNRPPGGNRVTDGLLDWLNNSVGAVMFLNTRSALLQTISSVNFINWGDNNIVKAGLAFANQKQFWSDFMTLMNSDYLVERRNGLKINVSESEIADAVKDSKNKVKSAIAFLLSKGFVMTRFADSFAIAAGGSTFYRNRVKSLLEKGGFKKPQVIFLTGAAGSGKTTAAKNFGKNWVVVNKDVEMEALMKKAGLPSDLNKLTREQRSRWRKIQEQASKNTLAEIKKLKEQGKNIIIDDTGSSEATISGLKRELEKSGYESKMLLLGTSLEQSLERNKARKQRTLTDVTVKNSFEALMGNKKRYKEIFKDNFTEAIDGKISDNLISELTGKISQKDAEAQAFDDFRQIAEESQQSSNPNRISAQQASGAGRVILAWANTPMQYARIQKRAAQDLINKRGDWKTNVSKIVYYGAIQNLIFNALQQAVFALGFGEDDEEEMDAKKSEKISRVANGMIDSQLKGLGIGGAAVVAVKSALMELGKQHAKDRSKYEEAVFDLLGFSPPLGSKIQKINSGLRSFSWNMKDIKSKGFSLDNPSYLAGAQITTGLTNIPFDRVMKKLNSMRGIVNEQSVLWQKVALGLGWSTWDVGLGYYGGFDAAKVLTPKEQAVEDVNKMKKETKTKEQIDMLLDLGLTKKEIKNLGKEQQRVEKIIELQKAEVTPKVKSEVKSKVKVEETKEKPKVKTKPKTETAERRLRRQFDSIKGENKPEQVKTLLNYGLSKKQIRALRYEKNRVEKILELMYKNKKK